MGVSPGAGPVWSERVNMLRSTADAGITSRSPYAKSDLPVVPAMQGLGVSFSFRL